MYILYKVSRFYKDYLSKMITKIEAVFKLNLGSKIAFKSILENSIKVQRC